MSVAKWGGNSSALSFPAKAPQARVQTVSHRDVQVSSQLSNTLYNCSLTRTLRLTSSSRSSRSIPQMTCGLARWVLPSSSDRVNRLPEPRWVPVDSAGVRFDDEVRQALTHQASKEDLPLRTLSRTRISGIVRQGRTTMCELRD
jgi:hypothetical protein